MSVFLILIPISLGLAIAFVLLCLASIKGGQFDDLESPRWRILFEGAPAAAREAAPLPVPHPAPLPQGRIPSRKNDETHPV